MKKFLFFILTLPFLGLAQTVPQGINYQAVARDASGAVLVNQSLIVQFSVISDVTTSTVSWQETHTATTNDHGLFTAIIGQGTATSIGNSATFDAINWGASNHLLKVEVDYGNGIFVDMGTTAFLSVPYALSSGSSANALWQDNGGYITNIGGGEVRIDGFSHNIGDGGIFGVNTDLHGDMVNLGDGFMGVNTEMGGFMTIIRGGDTRIESPLEVWNNAQFDQNVNISGDVSGSNAPVNADHLTRKDYVDAADAAILDSVSALDSTMIANTLWQDNGGYITNIGGGDVRIDGFSHNIGDGGIFGVNTDLHGDMVNLGDGFMGVNTAMGGFRTIIRGGDTRIESPLEVWNDAQFDQNVNISGDVSGLNAPVNADHLTRKDYVDAADAAILDSVSALDSTMIANALWQDNGGYITNIGGGDVRIDGFSHNIGDGGFMGVNTELHGDRVNLGDGIFGVNTEMGGHMVNLGDGFMGVNTEMGGFMTIIRGGDTRIESPLEVWNDAQFLQNVNISGDVSGLNAPVNADHLTRKDYVDAADAAILDSVSALDSTMIANALWQDNGGYITNIGGGEVRIDGFSHNIGDGGFMGVNTELHGDRVNLGDGIFGVNTEMGGHMVNLGDGFMGVNTDMGGFWTIIRGGDTRIESPLEVWNDAQFLQNVNISGDVSGLNAPVNADHLTRKDYVDAADAAILDSVSALDSTMIANTLWQDNGGYITNIGGGDVRIDGFSHNIGDGGIFGVNTEMGGHRVNLGDGMRGVNTEMGGDMVNLGDGFMGVNTEMGGFMTIIRGGDTRIESPLEVWNDAQFDQNVNISGDVSGLNAPVNADHLTRKDYVDAADAAILDSVSALDSTMIANALWQDNGGYITNIGGGDVSIDGFSHNIGDGGFMGVNTELHGDRVNLGDGIMGVNTEMGGFLTIIRGGDTRIESPLEVWHDAQFFQNVNISGDLYATGQLLSSDRRFKRDIVTVKNALSKVLQLRGVNYYWKQQEFPNRNFDEKLELGLIAQEVELIIPEIVAEAEDGYKAVEYQKLVALLIEAIKEQQTIIEGQKTEMADMRVELDSRLKALEDILTTTTLNTK